MNEQKPIAELVAELRGLLAKATPGPWDVFDVDDYSGIRAADGERVVQILRYESDANFCEEDDLIVAMRNSLPAILDELERLQGSEQGKRPHLSDECIDELIARSAFREYGCVGCIDEEEPLSVAYGLLATSPGSEPEDREFFAKCQQELHGLEQWKKANP